MNYFLFILGAFFGSFLNVCIHRLPRGESILFPPSHCPQCGEKIAAVDLIPILSFILLRGKCRSCGARISLRYPLVEALTGIIFVSVFIHTGGDIFNSVFELGFSCLFLVLFFTDLEMQLIPDSVSVTGIFAGLIYNYARGSNPLLSALLGMISGYVLLYGIGKLGELWFKKEVMGEGDLYTAAFLGAALGFEGLLLSVFSAYVLAGAAAFLLLAFKKVRMGELIPFGPALAAGGILTLFLGDKILGWYWGLFL